MPEYSVEDLIRKEADSAGVPAELALAVAEQESGFNPTAKSPKGALGTMQLMPNTAKIYNMDPNDPVQNIRGGVLHLRSLLDSHQGDLNKVLAAYNSGRTDNLPPETQAYVPGVLGRMTKFGGQKPAQPAQVGAPPPTPPAPRETPYVDEGASGTHSLLSSAVAGLNPWRAEGRRNLAGTAGALLAGAATGGLGTVPGLLAAGARFAIPVAGAALGGAAAETGEQAVGNAPPDPSRVRNAAIEQGLGEAGGAAVAWPLKAIGSRLARSWVGKATVEKFGQTLTDASAAMENIRTATSKALTKQTVTAATEKAGKEMSIDASKAKLGSQLASLPGGPPPAAVGKQVNAVIQGPAKSVLEQAGNRVEETALDGPMVSLKAVREKIAKVGEQMRRPGVGAAPPETAYITEQHRALMSPDDLKLLQQVEDNHPVKGILGELDKLGDEIPFAEAHRIKRLLDETVNWESPAKKIVQQATKGVRQELRAAMSGHLPYDEATKAYQDLVPLFRKGIAPRLKKQIAENPEVLVNSISPKKVTQVQMIKDLLLDTAGQADPSGWTPVTRITKAGLPFNSDKATTWMVPKAVSDAEAKQLQDLYGGNVTRGFVRKDLIDLNKNMSDETGQTIVEVPTNKLLGGGFRTDAPVGVGAKQEGQAAWNALRSEWTANNLINGPVEGLGKRLAKIPPEFRSVFYDDATGQQVLKGLEDIAGAYDQAIQSGRITLKSHSLGSTIERANITEAGRKALEPHQALTQQTRQDMQEFGKSSLSKRHSMEGLLTDAVRAVTMSPASGFQNVAAFRILFQGPKTKDLIRWAAYSGNSEKFVSVLTSPYPGTALAALAKTPGFLDILHDKEEGLQTPQPEAPPVRAQGPAPARQQLGGPPPAVPR
jgi:hypothetical protein